MKRDKILYFHINPLKNEIFYVGIGGKYRPRNKQRSNYWKNTAFKYGYIIDIIETNLTWEEACEREKFYIKFIGRKDLGLGPLINHTDGGDVGSLGFKKTAEMINKVVMKNTGKKRTQEQKDRMSKAQKGRTFTDETRKKMSITKKGKPGHRLGKKHSQESILLMSVTNKNKGIKTISQYDSNGVWIRDWNSLAQAAIELNIQPSGISKVINGHRQTVGGYNFKLKQ